MKLSNSCVPGMGFCICADYLPDPWMGIKPACKLPIILQLPCQALSTEFHLSGSVSSLPIERSAQVTAGSFQAKCSQIGRFYTQLYTSSSHFLKGRVKKGISRGMLCACTLKPREKLGAGCNHGTIHIQIWED